jgi:hypothetical protein
MSSGMHFLGSILKLDVFGGLTQFMADILEADDFSCEICTDSP